MSCPVCPMKLTPEVYAFVSKACGPCKRQIEAMKAGFHGVSHEPQKIKTTWDNTKAFEEWKAQLKPEDITIVHVRKKDDAITQYRDLYDMKKIVGLPNWLPLEDQVYTGWICEGQKDERLQEVLGLTYSQLFAVKSVVKNRLQKQMLYWKQVKKLSEEGKSK